MTVDNWFCNNNDVKTDVFDCYGMLKLLFSILGK